MTPRKAATRLLGLFAVGLVAGLLAPIAPPAQAAPPPVALQLLALNDFHGQLEPPTGGGARLPGFADELGGAEYLATQVKALEAASKKQNTLTVAAGDLVGATPLLSAAFHDEPAVDALDALGLDYASVGNHEFDEGADELLRLQRGGCHPVDGCSDPALPYDGADFRYLSANAFRTATGEPLLAPYAIAKVQGVRVGFIGMTLEATPSIVTASGVAGLTFGDEADTANRYAAELQAKGVEAIVVLLHEGGRQAAGGGVDDCVGLTGPITAIVPRFSDAIDVVVTGHTHQAYTCRLDGRLVTSASSAGRLVTDIDLTLDRRTGDVLTARADNVGVTRDVAKDPAQTALIGRYRTLLGPVAGRVVGTLTASATREQSALGESALGDLVADAQLAATDDEQGAVAAFMNPGGLRADLLAGEVTYEEAFAAQPFGNLLTSLTLTGAQVQCLLEQQFVVRRTLQPSAGVTYAVSASGTAGTTADPCAGTKVVDASVRLGGQPVVADRPYRITVNSFLADGGDGFTVLRQGTARVNGGADVDALVAYLEVRSPVSPPTRTRITAAP